MLPRNKRRATAAPRRKRAVRSVTTRRSIGGKLRLSNYSKFVSVMQFTRTVISSLPIDNISSLLSFFDLAFNFIKNTVSSGQSLYSGAYAMFGINPGALLKNSPMLADTSTGFSFPGHPVSVKNISMTFRNTSSLSAQAGKWAIVFIPYREEHDAKNYVEVLEKMTFSDVVAMPHAKHGPANKELRFNYRMSDLTSYCARPRELKEEIGVVYIIWDSPKDAVNRSYKNSDFNCEIDIAGKCLPHQIFGSSHRVTYPKKDFEIRSLTDGKLTRVHLANGEVAFESSSKRDSIDVEFTTLGMDE